MIRNRWLERSSHEPASYTANAEPRRLFGSENDKFDRAPWTKTAAHQRADCLQTAEYADSAIVAACIGNRVNMGPGGNHGKIGNLPGPTRKRVSHRIFTNEKPSLAA